MMGTSHAVTGAAAWVAITATTLPALHLYPVTPVGVVLGAMVCAGAALLPDADHHDATIAHSVPVLGRVTAGTVERISGGHRHGMHSLLAVIGILAATIALSTLRWTPTGWDHPIQLGSAIAVMACVTFATRVLTLVRSWPAAWRSAPPRPYSSRSGRPPSSPGSRCVSASASPSTSSGTL